MLFFLSHFLLSLLQVLPLVPRLFCPAVACPTCSYPNDQTFRFCQQCVFQRRPRPPPTLLSFELDLHSIDARLAELRLAASAAPYEKQKSALQQELETFLAALPLPKNLPSSSPDDIWKFLVWKDRLGKTQVHATGCPHLGKKGITLCGCPLSFSLWYS